MYINYHCNILPSRIRIEEVIGIRAFKFVIRQVINTALLKTAKQENTFFEIYSRLGQISFQPICLA